MPPKIDIKTLTGKRDNAIHALKELFDEFETLYSVKPELNLLAAIFNEIESKYRTIKKQIEAIADRFVEEGVTSENEKNNRKSESWRRNQNTVSGNFAKICQLSKGT